MNTVRPSVMSSGCGPSGRRNVYNQLIIIGNSDWFLAPNCLKVASGVHSVCSSYQNSDRHRCSPIRLTGFTVVAQPQAS